MHIFEVFEILATFVETDEILSPTCRRKQCKYGMIPSKYSKELEQMLVRQMRSDMLEKDKR